MLFLSLPFPFQALLLIAFLFFCCKYPGYACLQDVLPLLYALGNNIYRPFNGVSTIVLERTVAMMELKLAQELVRQAVNFAAAAGCGLTDADVVNADKCFVFCFAGDFLYTTYFLIFSNVFVFPSERFVWLLTDGTLLLLLTFSDVV